MLTVAYLGLGANLGDPIQQLIDAREALMCLSATKSLRTSSFYLSSPVGFAEQADFINCVVELTTSDTPIALLDDMQSIENMLGRQRVIGNQNSPRLIDIDLLLYGEQQIDTERLKVPHPRMKSRLFVLKPLLELKQIETYRLALDAGYLNHEFDGQTLHRLRISD